MSRGGRFGGGTAGPKSLYDADPALESEVVAYTDNDDKPLHDKSRHYPPMRIPNAPPVTRREKREFEIYRRMLAKRRAGPYFLDDIDLGNNDPARFNAFEDINTYSNQQKKKARGIGGLPDLTKLDINWETMPKELQFLQYGTSEGGVTRKNADLAKKAKDRIARIKDNEGDAENRNLDDEEDDDNEDDEEGRDESLQDDDFDEDEDDAAGDYNAEQFFDNGEDDDMDDGGGGEDAW